MTESAYATSAPPNGAPTGAPSERGVRSSLHLDLQPSVYAVATARRCAIELLRRPVAEEHVRVIGLLTSELVTNAVVHATTPFALDISLEGSVVRVSVADGAGGRPRPDDHGDGAEGGWGLKLVADLATRWGSEVLPGGKHVWFELDVAAPR